MESSVANALLLLLVGMITVFLILFLVVTLGTILIKLTNSLYKEPKKVSNPGLPAKTIAAITAVVEHVTAGQGIVDSIEQK